MMTHSGRRGVNLVIPPSRGVWHSGEQMGPIWVQDSLVVESQGRGLYDVTKRIDDVVQKSGVVTGLCNVFLQHTSASLIIQENADPDVRHDLEQWFNRTVPDGDPRYRHRAEGPDDMSSHIRSAITQPSLMIPVTQGALGLGLWQGLYLFEHRTSRHQRRITVTVCGSKT